MGKWEYLHVRAKVGMRDYSSFSGSQYAVYHVNGKELVLEVDSTSGAGVQDSVVALLNKLGMERWELVSHSQQVLEIGIVDRPTEYSFFLKRPL